MVIALSVAGDIGALPLFAPGAELGVSLGLPGFRATAFGAAFASQETRLASGGGGEFRLALGGVLGCVEREAGTFGVLGCAGFELGRLSGRGVGVRTPHEGAATWAAGRAEIGLGLPVGSGFSLTVRGAATLPFIRKDFVLDDSENVHTPSGITGRALLGFEVKL